MSTDTGPRKRNKDKKRKKGSAGEGDTAVTIPRDIPAMKLIADETIHVQNEVNVGGNILSKLIFVCLFLLLGLSLVFIWTEYNGFDGDGTGTQKPWLTQFIDLSFFSSQRPAEEPVSTADSKPEASGHNFFQQWLDFWPFSIGGSVDTDFFGDLKKENAEDDSRDDTSDDREDNADEQDHSDGNDDDQGEDADEESEETNQLDDSNDEEDEPDDENDEDDSVPLNVNRRDHDEDGYSSKYRFNYRAVDDSKRDRFGEFDYDNDDYSDRNRKNDLDENDESEEEKEGVDEKDDNREDDDEDDEGNDGGDERDDDDEGDEQEEPEDTDDQKELESDIPSDTEERRDDASEDKTEEETTTTNVVTKLGVGVALIIVAYTVVIRKWNNYANLLDQVFEEAAEQDQPEEQIPDLYAFNDKDQFQENKTLQEYLDTPTASESEDSRAENARWSTSGADILAQEVGDSDSVTSESELNDSDIEPSATFDRYVTHGYDKANITNQFDWQHREDLDDADEDFDGGRINVALDKYRRILRSHEHSVRAKYGIARVLDQKAEQLRSNKLLEDAIAAYEEALRAPDVPDILLEVIAERAVNRTRFVGEYDRSIFFQKALIDRFPNEIKYQNDLVVTLLIMNRIPEAKEKLENILRRWPNDELAAVYYGFVLKVNGQLSDAVEYLYRGIKSSQPGTQDSRFYFQLGDALQRLKREEEAMKVYERAVEKGMFLSKYQRSLYNVDRLTARPWWSAEQTTYQSFFKTLEMNWRSIRNEALAVLKSDKKSKFQEESEQLRETGDWRQLDLFTRGIRRPQCDLVPLTCRLISDFQPAAGCRRGQVKFSIMEPKTHVWPHCGPTNCRLRAHLGLVIPANVFIRVGNVTRSWEEGKIFIFDDSFEHEVWHNGTTYRLILIVDVWHPELTPQERRTLTPI